MKYCLIELQGHPGSLQIWNAYGCIILCGPISRWLFAENCSQCTFVVPSQQLRLHSSLIFNCRLYIQGTSRAIIEDSCGILIGHFNYDHETIEEDFKISGLLKTKNNNKNIADFNWLSVDVGSPNWKLFDKNNSLFDWFDFTQDV